MAKNIARTFAAESALADCVMASGAAIDLG